MRGSVSLAVAAVLSASSAAVAQDRPTQWLLNGNSGTSASNFLGTTSNEPLIFKADGKEAARILPNGSIGIGTTEPAAALAVTTSFGQDALQVTTTGSGNAGDFIVSNAASQSDAVYATTNAPELNAVHGLVANGSVAIRGDDVSPATQTGYAVLGYTQHGYGVFGYLIDGNDSANHGSAGLSGVYAEDVSPANAYTYGLYASSPHNIAVYGTSSYVSARFAGGVSGTGSVAFTGGGSWNFSSDRNLKEDFAPVDTSALLDRLALMPIFTFHYKNSEDHALFLGPTAQDFAAAFHLGDGDDTKINGANIEGVAVAAAKGLYEELKRDEDKLKQDEATIAAANAKIAALERQLAEQKVALAAVVEAVARLEKTGRYASARPLRQASLGQR